MAAQNYKLITLLLIAFNCTLGSMAWGYNISIFNSLRSYLENKVFQAESNQIIGLITSMPLAGAFIGSYFTGDIMSKYGRLNTLFLADIIGIIGCLLSMVHSLPILILGRLISGLPIGINSVTVKLYNVEMAPLSLKGIMGAMAMCALSFGVLLGYLVEPFVPEHDDDPTTPINNVWRLLFAAPFILHVVRMCVFWFSYRYETPFYLVSKGREEEAREVLSVLYNDTESVEGQLNKVKSDVDAATSAGELSVRDLMGPKYRKAFFLCVYVAMALQLVGFSPIFMYFSKFIQDSADNEPETKALFSSLLGIISFLMTVVITLLIEKLGRRPLMIVGMGLMAFCKLVFVFIWWTQGSSAPILKYILICWPVFFRISVGTLAFVYVSEILPGVGVSFAVFMSWVGAFAMVLPFVTLVNWVGYDGVLLLYAIYCLVSVYVFKLYVLETKGKTKAELLQEFAGKDYSNEPNTAYELKQIPLLAKDKF